ncbi:unnamed protein product [Rhizophagus irregularis]|uniref:Uncharacterized protein n=1 Tax=Rhizophagus irregularis TaxID=588596 RepID=A0A915YYG6_9GLOM|nr:unnamed protein product [Rhizophagus irregularis]
MWYLADGIISIRLIQIQNVIGNNIGWKGRPNIKEMDMVEKEAYKCIELAISEINDFNKIIKYFTKNKGTHVELKQSYCPQIARQNTL